MTKINNQLIEFEHVYCGILTADSISKVRGHRVFNSNGNFEGLYDKEHNAIWNIDVQTLQVIK